LIGLEKSGSGLLQSLSEEIVKLRSEVSRSVVGVQSPRRSGSGVVWDSEIVVTCAHVVGRANQVSVLVNGKTFEGTVLGRNRFLDVAVIKLEKTDLNPIPRSEKRDVSPGEFVLALANPTGNGPAATSGIVTGLRSFASLRWGGVSGEAILTDARLNPGYSGGPLVNAGGEMIGLNAAYVASRGLAIPTEQVSRAVDSIKSRGDAQRAYIGIVSNPVEIPADLVKSNELSADSGLMVYSVDEGSPAKKAGLILGDIIVGFDGRPVRDHIDLQVGLGEDAVGKQAKLTVLRGGKSLSLEVTPVAKSQEMW
jgi:S1-C subfamily serine protease